MTSPLRRSHQDEAPSLGSQIKVWWAVHDIRRCMLQEDLGNWSWINREYRINGKRRSSQSCFSNYSRLKEWSSLLVPKPQQRRERGHCLHPAAPDLEVDENMHVQQEECLVYCSLSGELNLHLSAIEGWQRLYTAVGKFHNASNWGWFSSV